MTKLAQVGRLALRREGKWWNAYYATTESMEGAELLGSIRMTIVENNPKTKEMFMDAMREAVADMVEHVTGTRPTWGGPQPAPEHERAGQG